MKHPLLSMITGVLFMTALLLTGCASSDQSAQNSTAATQAQTETAGNTESTGTDETTEPGQETDGTGEAFDPDAPLTAMYLTDRLETSLFIGVDNGVLFTAPLPDELYDAEGNKITKDQLTVGTTLDIYGNNIMLESYPGQYPGVTKMVVVTEGTEADTAPYQELIDQVIVEPDPSQPPSMNLTYTSELGNITVMLPSGGFEWSYEDENGEPQHMVADGVHILDWGDLLVDVTLSEPTDLTLLSSHPLTGVEIRRWPSDALGTQQYEDYETIEAAEQDGSFVIPQAEAGYVYLVIGSWENGSGEFGFYTR